jgi:Uma2 family endonuclease
MSTVPAAPPRLMTAEEFGDWANSPENEHRWFELVRGEVIELPPPKKPHGIICLNVARPLDTFARKRRKGYVTINDAGVILERDPDTVRGPDVALYEDEDTFDVMPPGYGEVPPVLAVEVLSPDDRADQINRKITDYLQNGVRLVWLLDPEVQTVTVYCRDKGPQLLQGTQRIAGGDVLPGFKCRVSDFFILPGKAAKEKKRATSTRRGRSTRQTSPTDRK